jgi:hypothetical protein
MGASSRPASRIRLNDAFNARSRRDPCPARGGRPGLRKDIVSLGFVKDVAVAGDAVRLPSS